MKYEPTNRRVLLWSIIVALAAWGVLLALGAYLGLDPQTPDHDWRRVGIALAAVAATCWVAASEDVSSPGVHLSVLADAGKLSDSPDRP
jgi:hypothetical protein